MILRYLFVYKSRKKDGGLENAFITEFTRLLQPKESIGVQNVMKQIAMERAISMFLTLYGDDNMGIEECYLVQGGRVTEEEFIPIQIHKYLDE